MGDPVPQPVGTRTPTTVAPDAPLFKPTTPVHVPDAHSVNTITGKTRFGAGNRNTPKTVLKGDVDTAADIAEINAGRATRLPNGDIQTSSGRIYGTHPDKPSVFPRRGPGAINLTQAEFDVYRRMVDSGGLVGDAKKFLDGLLQGKNGGVSPQSEQKLLELYNSRK
jgi:hypothetical protein